MLPFVVLRHDVGPEFGRTSDSAEPAHYDWMFQVGQSLRTWATEPIESLLQEGEIDATALPDHRLKYLQFEGDIGGQRGSVKSIVRGDYSLIQQDEEQFCVIASWVMSDGEIQSRPLKFYRSSSRGDASDESRLVWRLRLG